MDFPHFGVTWLSETGQIGGYENFFGTQGRDGLKFDMLMIPDYLWNWLHFGHSPDLGGILTQWKGVKLAVFRHFLESAWEEWSEIFHADVCWSPSELIGFWLMVCWFSSLFHVQSVVLWQTNLPLTVKGATAIRSFRSTCSSLFCDIWRNEKDKFYHMKIIQLPSRRYARLLCSQAFLVKFTIQCVASRPTTQC